MYVCRRLGGRDQPGNRFGRCCACERACARSACLVRFKSFQSLCPCPFPFCTSASPLSLSPPLPQLPTQLQPALCVYIYGRASFNVSIAVARPRSKFPYPGGAKFPYPAGRKVSILYRRRFGTRVSILYRRRFFAVQRRTPQLGFQCRPAPDPNRFGLESIFSRKKTSSACRPGVM